MRLHTRRQVLWLSGILVDRAILSRDLGVKVYADEALQLPFKDPRNGSCPWGVASGAEWLSDYSRFNPVLEGAGVRWLRAFYEWQTIQPRRDEWDFSLPDRLVRNAKQNNLQLIDTLAYFAPWASADGGTRRFPIKNIQYWRDYVAGMVKRYHDDIKYWEIWNEFNGSFAENGTPQMYCELVREASQIARGIDPTAQIGMSVANFDVGFLEAAIKAGAADHFDYICIHPYEMLAGLSEGGEGAFLSMSATLRAMLKANHQSATLPLWITEIGVKTAVKPNAPLDELQAEALVKAYILAIASGFERVFWFEARGPSYGDGQDFGLLRADWSVRPSLVALKSLTTTLGLHPRLAGWLNLGEAGFGFLFERDDQPILTAWTPSAQTTEVIFNSDVSVVHLNSGTTRLLRGTPLRLTSSPVFIVDPPQDLVERAKEQVTKPYSWGTNASEPLLARIDLGAANVEHGIRQIRLSTTRPAPGCRLTDFARADQEGHYVYFQVDQGFVGYGTKKLKIIAVVRRLENDRPAGMSLDYESAHGYVNSAYAEIAGGGSWDELSWTVHDANFVGAWGWNFRLNAISSPNDFMMKEVRVKKLE